MIEHAHLAAMTEASAGHHGWQKSLAGPLGGVFGISLFEDARTFWNFATCATNEAFRKGANSAAPIN